jgi:hypothetical protein
MREPSSSAREDRFGAGIASPCNVQGAPATLAPERIRPEYKPVAHPHTAAPTFIKVGIRKIGFAGIRPDAE